MFINSKSSEYKNILELVIFNYSLLFSDIINFLQKIKIY